MLPNFVNASSMLCLSLFDSISVCSFVCFFVPLASKTVNKNLIGTGYMSTDQKKKLLWGNKKNTTAEEVLNLITLSCRFIVFVVLFTCVGRMLDTRKK